MSEARQTRQALAVVSLAPGNYIAFEVNRTQAQVDPEAVDFGRPGAEVFLASLGHDRDDGIFAGQHVFERGNQLRGVATVPTVEKRWVAVEGMPQVPVPFGTLVGIPAAVDVSV